ncbi:hypothetical protein BH11MYX4_BH11MYX4_61710 [soil metagenome]
MRRLPVIQPTAFERRAFLLGMVGVTVAACASESPLAPQRSSSSSGGPAPTASGGSDSAAPGADAGDAEPDPVIPGQDAGVDASDAAPAPGCPVVGYDAGGPPASFAMGTVTYIAAAGAYVGRDAGGLYGMYALCTHSVGNLRIDPTQLTCLVHGARFSLTGAVLQGPANMALPHFALCLNAKGNVAIDTKVIVPAATRMSI